MVGSYRQLQAFLSHSNGLLNSGGIPFGDAHLEDLTALQAASLGNMTTAGVAKLSLDQLAGVSTAQMQALSTAQVKALTTEQAKD